MYYGYIIKVERLHKHENADRLKILSVFGTETIVSANTEINDIGIYFPSDGQLSKEFCEVNNLTRKLDGSGGFLDPEKRNIKAMKVRGMKSDGLYLPISCLSSFCDISQLAVGDKISIINGHEICHKYIPKDKNNINSPIEVKNAPKEKNKVCKIFKEHIDTQQLAYNLDKFKTGDIIEISLKIHGTSGRTGYLPVTKYKKKFFNLIKVPYTEYSYITGTRRTVLELSDTITDTSDANGGFYGDNTFRYMVEDMFKGKLHKGEVVYYEIAGFTNRGVPIMGEVDNQRTKDKDFIKKYGEKTIFSYSCRPHPEVIDCGNGHKYYDDTAPQFKVFVYRMTLVNEDGYSIEYSPEKMRERCAEIGVYCVPRFKTTIIPAYCRTNGLMAVDPGEFVMREAEGFFDGADPIGKTHIREGVVVRILNRPAFEVYKHKNFNFKVIEGIIKTEAEVPDMEEAQEEV